MKILFATDGSEHSEKAARFLARFGLSSGDEILVLYTMTLLPVINELEAFYVDFGEIKRAVVPGILSASEGILKGGAARVSSRCIEEFPDKGITETAESGDFDLIVMGAHGRRRVESYIVGSVTRSVAVRSGRPVLIVKPPQQEEAGNLRILFASDGSPHSNAMADTLSRIPFPPGTEVTIMTVTFSALADIPERFAPEINDRIKGIVAGSRESETAVAEKILQKAREGLKGKFGHVPALTRSGDPADEILKAAGELNAGIIALGSSGMRGLKGMLGSVSRYVLNHAACSVLIGKG